MMIVLGIVVLLFGRTKIPQLMRGVGEGMRELRHATREDDEPPAPARLKPSQSNDPEHKELP